MPKNELWFRRRNPKEPCPICGRNMVSVGVPMCYECAKKKPLFDGD